MYKQSSGRNNRSKGFKIKHVIQIFVLVAICIWLIYQVKHSHDKKREFEEKNIKSTSSLSNGAGDEVIKFGRKDVQARFEKTTLVTDGKVEEAEDEEAEGGGGGQEDNKMEEDEQDQEDLKHEEKEDEGRGGGDDEIDENDQHKYDEDNLIDEKDAEGKDTEEEVDEERSERENLEEGERSEVENSEEGEKSDRESSEEGQSEREEEDHEAREEHYKADDASSAVAHETESESLEKLNEHSETEEESSNNAEEFSAQGNRTVHQNVLAANERSTLNSTMKVEEEKSSGLEEGNDPIEMSKDNSGTLLNSGDGKKSDLNATNNFTTQLEEEQKPQVTSQNIVHESASEVNTTTGAELDHSEAVEGVVESGKEDPNADSLLSDPIDSLDSSSSNLQDDHDHVDMDNDIRRTMEGNSNEDDATATM